MIKDETNVKKRKIEANRIFLSAITSAKEKNDYNFDSVPKISPNIVSAYSEYVNKTRSNDECIAILQDLMADRNISALNLFWCAKIVNAIARGTVIYSLAENQFSSPRERYIFKDFKFPEPNQELTEELL